MHFRMKVAIVNAKIFTHLHAIVDIRKLQDYDLNPHHKKRKYKARLFASLLGMSFNDVDGFWKGKQAIIRSAWIIEINSDVPKLTTTFPLIRKDINEK